MQLAQAHHEPPPVLGDVVLALLRQDRAPEVQPLETVRRAAFGVYEQDPQQLLLDVHHHQAIPEGLSRVRALMSYSL